MLFTFFSWIIFVSSIFICPELRWDAWIFEFLPLKLPNFLKICSDSAWLTSPVDILLNYATFSDWSIKWADVISFLNLVLTFWINGLMVIARTKHNLLCRPCPLPSNWEIMGSQQNLERKCKAGHGSPHAPCVIYTLPCTDQLAVQLLPLTTEHPHQGLTSSTEVF